MSVSQGVYSVSSSTAITAQGILQVRAGSTPLEILRIWVSETSRNPITLTVTTTNAGSPSNTALTPVQWSGSKSSTVVINSSTGTGANVTGGTGGSPAIVDICWNGAWRWVPTPEERLIVAPGGALLVRQGTNFVVASALYGAVWQETG